MAKWTRDHMLEIGAVLAVIGLALTIISFTYAFADVTPGWLTWYADLVNRPEGNYNTLFLILGPILLIMGGFYAGEQIVLRRRFERLMDTTKRSEFASNRRELEDLSKRLPVGYKGRLQAKEDEFRASTTSRRA